MGHLNPHLIRFGRHAWHLWNINRVIMMWIKRGIYVHGSSQLATDDLSQEGNTKYIQMSFHEVCLIIRILLFNVFQIKTTLLPTAAEINFLTGSVSQLTSRCTYYPWSGGRSTVAGVVRQLASWLSTNLGWLPLWWCCWMLIFLM